MEYRITIQWTETARKALAQLPRKVRAGLIAKIDGLQQGDPRELYKPLVGPLQGFRSVKYSRYRALYSVDTDESEKAVVVRIAVHVVLVGIRKEKDKSDIYEVAKRLLDLGIIPSKSPTDAD